MRYTNKLAAVAAVAITGASAVNITPTGDATVLAKALLGPGLTLESADFQGDASGSGTYTDGPLGIPNSIVLTSGNPLHPYAPSSEGTQQNVPGFGRCDTLSGGTSGDAAVLTMKVTLQQGYPGFFSQFVFASDEYPKYVGTQYNDVFGIWIDGTQIAFDDSGAPITINGPFFSSNNVLTPPASGPYGGSTPLLQSGYSSSPGLHTIEIAVCDVADLIRDSAVFVTLSGCSDASSCKNGTHIVPTTNTTSHAPYPTTSQDVITKYETQWQTITSCPASHPCHPVATSNVITYTLTQSVTVPCVTSTYVSSSSTYTTTVTLAPVTTWVTCDTHYTSTYTTPYASPTHSYSTYYTHKTSTSAVTYVATATKSYPPKNTTYPAATFTGAAAGVQSSVVLSGLVGLLALIPAFL